MPEWAHRKAVEKAALAKTVEKMSCTFATMLWLSEAGAGIDVAIPGSRTGDVPSGEELVGAWKGKRMVSAEHALFVLALHHVGGQVTHVRVDSGEVHQGAPGECYEGVCLAETVLES